MPLPRIFVSHSHKDNAWCEQLVEALKRAGLDVWFDKQGLYVGAQWVKRLEEELQQRDVFLIVLTPDSWASHWVQEELLLALGQRKQILGIMHKQTQMSGFITNRQLLAADGQTAEQAARLVAAALGVASQPPQSIASTPQQSPQVMLSSMGSGYRWMGLFISHFTAIVALYTIGSGLCQLS